jgi:hypothetical protein
MASLLGQQGLLADTTQARPEFNGGLHQTRGGLPKRRPQFAI